MASVRRPALLAAGILGVGALWTLNSALPAIGAGGLLHPARTLASAPTPASCNDSELEGAGVVLRGWQCGAIAQPRRGTIVYLHGIADNRSSAAGVIDRFTRVGFDVFAYDSRAHGQSTGDACTYGYYEKKDLRKILDGAQPGPIVLIGTSLGAAVALQEAADDSRVTAVVAAETFSDLRAVATERAPFVFTQRTIAAAFQLAEREAQFQVDAVSPLAAASRLDRPVLLIHGAADRETPPAHSQRVYAALRGPKRLILVPNAGHNGSLTVDVWAEIGRWVLAL